MADQAAKGLAFKALHENVAFVIPNPWDVGSARLLQGLGFVALATTSSGFAYTLGRADGQVTLAEKLAHCQLLCAATSVPITADLEDGFAEQPEGVANTIRQAAQTGIVGASIEDFSRQEHHIYPFNLAVERVAAAVEAAQTLSFPFTLTARAENLLRNNRDMDDTIKRLEAFAGAGADVLYAPGLTSLDDIATVARAVPRPLNVLCPFLPGCSVAELAAAGARRISVGGALAYASMAPIIEGGREVLEEGTLQWLSRLPPRGRVAELLAADDSASG